MKQGARLGMWWWEQSGIDLAETRDTEVTATEADKYGL